MILREKIGQCLFSLEEKAFFEKTCFKQFVPTEIYYLISATLSVKMPSGAKQFFSLTFVVPDNTRKKLTEPFVPEMIAFLECLFQTTSKTL